LFNAYPSSVKALASSSEIRPACATSGIWGQQKQAPERMPVQARRTRHVGSCADPGQARRAQVAFEVGADVVVADRCPIDAVVAIGTDVLQALRIGSAPLVKAIHRLTDGALDRPLFDEAGEPLAPFEAFVRQVVIGHVVDHLAEIREAIG